jgi:hypothetical protein
MSDLEGGTALASGLAFSDLSVSEMWVRYVGLSGAHTQQELQTYLDGHSAWSRSQHDVAAHALNEYFVQRGLDHLVAYAHEITPG